MSDYQSLYQKSIQNPRQFWKEASAEIDWIKAPQQILDTSAAPHHGRWFEDALCNSCYNCVDRHVEQGRGAQAAVIFDSAMTGECRIFTYLELQDEVAKLAGTLKMLGLEKGDRAIIYMPMIAESLIAMLACARIGVIHSVVFGGFAAFELAKRIKDAGPRIILSASCGLEPNRVVEYKPILDEALALCRDADDEDDADAERKKVEHVLLLQRPQVQSKMRAPRDLDWRQTVAKAQKADCVTLNACDPLYILYTSGTTGHPKGVLRDNGGHMVALKWTMKHLYNIDPGDVFWAASDVGWVVGHSYIVYAPLLHGATTLLYEGKPVGTPDAGAFWRVISQHKVKALFTAPTAFRAIRQQDHEGDLIKQYDISSLQALFLAGERLDGDTLSWAEKHLQIPVIDHWWQTETGWSIAGYFLGCGMDQIKPGSPGKAAPGYVIDILDHQGKKLKPGEMGSICVKLPLPPSCMAGLWRSNERFTRSFARFEGYYETGDAGYMDEDGYIFVMARDDDVINVAGHRFSTGALEEVLAMHDDVAECAVVGIKDTLKGQVPIGFLVLNAGAKKAHKQIIDESIAMLRQKIGAVAAFKEAFIVKRLPKTRSGKILRGVMRAQADGQPFKIPPTIDDATILDEISEALTKIQK